MLCIIRRWTPHVRQCIVTSDFLTNYGIVAILMYARNASEPSVEGTSPDDGSAAVPLTAFVFAA